MRPSDIWISLFLKECIKVLFVFKRIIDGLVQGNFQAITIPSASLIIAIFERFLVVGWFILVDVLFLLILNLILKIPYDRVVLINHDQFGAFHFSILFAAINWIFALALLILFFLRIGIALRNRLIFLQDFFIKDWLIQFKRTIFLDSLIFLFLMRIHNAN